MKSVTKSSFASKKSDENHFFEKKDDTIAIAWTS